MNKLHQALVSHLIEADDTNVADVHNEHASPDDNVHTHNGVEYIGNNVISTDAPTKISDVVFFGIVRGR